MWGITLKNRSAYHQSTHKPFHPQSKIQTQNPNALSSCLPCTAITMYLPLPRLSQCSAAMHVPRYARRISSQKPLKRSVKNGNIQETKIGYSSLFGRYSCTLFFSFQVIYRSLPVVSLVCSERWCIVCMEMLEPRFQCLFKKGANQRQTNVRPTSGPSQLDCVVSACALVGSPLRSC